MADYEFKYAPLTGRLTGKQMIEQTEQAINGLANLVDDAAGQVEIISTLANEANENAATALETAEEALATTGRTYITVSIPANANDYYDSQLIYIADNTSTNIPVADTGMLETKTNDNKTACEQVFIADSSGEAYYRHGDITAETVGDVTTYTVTWGGWSSEPASQQYVQEELASYAPLSALDDYAPLTDLNNYLPRAGGTMSGNIAVTSGRGIRGENDDQLVRFRAGTDDSSSYISLYGKNFSDSSLAGQVAFRVRDTNYNKVFYLAPDGTAKWNNANILTDATVGTIVSKTSSDVSVGNTSKAVVSISLAAGTWVVTGTLAYDSTVVGRQFAGLNTSTSMTASTEGTVIHYSNVASNYTLALTTTRIFVLSSTTTVNLNGLSQTTVTTGTSTIRAVRIV